MMLITSGWQEPCPLRRATKGRYARTVQPVVTVLCFPRLPSFQFLKGRHLLVVKGDPTCSSGSIRT